MRRGSTFLFVPLLAVVGLMLASHAAGASTIPGLGQCPTSSSCDLSAIGVAFPNYSTVCSHEDCNFVSAADWELVVESISPSASQLSADLLQSGITASAGASLSGLWTYWRTTGIDGLFLTRNAQVSRLEAATERAVKADGALIEVNVSKRGASIGTVRMASAGTEILLVDGFTPKGPLVVFQHRTRQMTWIQWRAEARSVWSAAVTTTPPAPVVTGPPTVTLQASSSVVPSTGSTVTLNYDATNAQSCVLSSVPVIWNQGSISVPCQGYENANIASSTTAGSWTFTFTASGTNSATATATVTVTQEAPVGSAAQFSKNWAGYVVPSPGNVVTDAEGDFTVPTMNCGSQTEGVASLWVGTGGAGYLQPADSGTLLQTGVTAVCLGGLQLDYGWWELYPSTPNQSEPFLTLNVAPGDVMHAAVYETPSGAWETELDDLTTGITGRMITGQSWGVGPTTGGTFSVEGSTLAISYGGGYTAEWIVEDPTNTSTNSLAPFGNFGTVTFTNLKASVSNWSLTLGETVALVNMSTVYAAPISTGPDDFSVAYQGP